MPRGFSTHNNQTVPAFALEPVHQSPRFLMSQLGRFTASLTKNRPKLVLKIAGHLGTQPSRLPV